MTQQNRQKSPCGTYFSHHWDKIPSRRDSEGNGTISAHIFMVGKAWHCSRWTKWLLTTAVGTWGHLFMSQCNRRRRAQARTEPSQPQPSTLLLRLYLCQLYPISQRCPSRPKQRPLLEVKCLNTWVCEVCSTLGSVKPVSGRLCIWMSLLKFPVT